MRWSGRRQFALMIGLMSGTLTACSQGPPAAPQASTPVARGVAPRPQPAKPRDWQAEISVPMALPGLRTPEVQSPDAAKLEDDAAVIGVAIGGRHRAYLIKAMSQVKSHVVNDLIDEVPVTVTFCDRREVTRVFTSGESREPLTIGMAGWMGPFDAGLMALRIDGRVVPQESAEIEQEELDYERTTWKEWLDEHPDTDVYTGHRLNPSRPPGEFGAPPENKSR